MSRHEKSAINNTRSIHDNSTKEFNSLTNSKVDLNNLMKRIKEDEKRSKRQNITLSAIALSVVAVFGVILTL